nr:unnamed protein product [Digitaria exilis]
MGLVTEEADNSRDYEQLECQTVRLHALPERLCSCATPAPVAAHADASLSAPTRAGRFAAQRQWPASSPELHVDLGSARRKTETRTSEREGVRRCTADVGGEDARQADPTHESVLAASRRESLHALLLPLDPVALPACTRTLLPPQLTGCTPPRNLPARAGIAGGEREAEKQDVELWKRGQVGPCGRWCGLQRSPVTQRKMLTPRRRPLQLLFFDGGCGPCSSSEIKAKHPKVPDVRTFMLNFAGEGLAAGLEALELDSPPPELEHLAPTGGESRASPGGLEERHGGDLHGAAVRAHGVLLRAMEGAADADSAAMLDSMAPLLDSTTMLLDSTTGRASVGLRWLLSSSLSSGCCSLTPDCISVNSVDSALSRAALKAPPSKLLIPVEAKEAMARTWREGSASEMGCGGEETQLCVAPRRRRKMGLVDGSSVGAGFGEQNTVDDAKWVWLLLPCHPAAGLPNALLGLPPQATQ